MAIVAVAIVAVAIMAVAIMAVVVVVMMMMLVRIRLVRMHLVRARLVRMVVAYMRLGHPIKAEGNDQRSDEHSSRRSLHERPSRKPQLVHAVVAHLTPAPLVTGCLQPDMRAPSRGRAGSYRAKVTETSAATARAELTRVRCRAPASAHGTVYSFENATARRIRVG
ncbi:MAG: hypothetical protein ACLPV4_03975 [Solirubrobacteraceae bacterium]